MAKKQPAKAPPPASAPILPAPTTVGGAAYPLSAVRRLALHTQGLTTPNGAESTPDLDAIARTIRQLVCVQIDTLHLVQRSQYLCLWSRLGTYDPADLDRAAYGDPADRKGTRRLYEYWLKEASLIPLEDFRYSLTKMHHYRNGGRRWFLNWRENPENAALIAHILGRIEAEGGLRGADFEYKGEKRGSWWDWKPAKLALEGLYNEGYLMIEHRVNFQRVYNLTERVLPDWVDRTEPTPDETHRHLLIRALRALGAAGPHHIGHYVRIGPKAARPVLNDLIRTGEVHPIQVEQVGGGTAKYLIHRDDLPTLQRAADGEIAAPRTTFLTPFDNLMWGIGRELQLWGFKQILECYKPAPQRIWGYFCLPILHKDRLIGRFDPKLERATGVLRIKALHLEPGIAPEAGMVADVAAAMRDFMKFHKAKTLVIEASNPPEFGAALMRAM